MKEYIQVNGEIVGYDEPWPEKEEEDIKVDPVEQMGKFLETGVCPHMVEWVSEGECLNCGSKVLLFVGDRDASWIR